MFSPRILFIVLFVVSLVPTSTARSQETQTIDGKLTKEKKESTHSITLKKDQFYLIDMTSNQFDAVILLKDGAGKELASDDDAGEGLNARIGIKVTATDYQIVATSFGGGSIGEYKIIIRPISKVGDVKENKGAIGDKSKTLASGLPFETLMLDLQKGKIYELHLQTAKFTPTLLIRNEKTGGVLEGVAGRKIDGIRLFYIPKDSGKFPIVIIGQGIEDLSKPGMGEFTLSVQEFEFAAEKKSKKKETKDN